jgi:formate dehydrogenase maturation protein FdhE
VLEFYAVLAEWLAGEPSDLFGGLVDLVERIGPAGLQQADRTLEWGPLNFYGRVCRMAEATRNPGCEGPPQVGCLVPQGEGQALELVCAVCLGRRPFPRGRCPGCAGGRLVYYCAEQFRHLQVQACEACRCYLLLVDLGKDPEAIPEVDELAALPLDVWAQQQGYRKLFPNLAGV